MSIESVVPSNCLILCRPLLLPSILPSIRVVSSESALLIMWPKYWSFSFSISASNEHPGLISFYDGLVGSPCRPSYSQESSPTPQFKSINSSALNLLYDPTLTSVHDYWKKTQLWLYGPLSTKWWLWFLISCLRVTTKTMHLTKHFFIIMFNLLQQPCMVVLFCTFWR